MNRLKELRTNKKKTQQDIADLLQMSRRGYQKIENGESQIKPDKAEKLADYFGVSVGYLLGYSDFENAKAISAHLKSQQHTDINEFVQGKIFQKHIKHPNDKEVIQKALDYDLDKNIDNLISLADIFIEKHNEIFSMIYAYAKNKYFDKKKIQQLSKFLEFYQDFSVENNDYNLVFQDMIGNIIKGHTKKIDQKD